MPLISASQKQTESALKPPQFRLRTMLIAVAVICVLLAVMVAVGMIWAMALLMFVLLIAAHVVGNSLGTQLRDHGSRVAVLAEREETRHTAESEPNRPASRWQPPSAGRMQEKRPVGWLLIVLTVVGGLATGVVGGSGISSLYWDRIGPVAMAMATLASGIVGAMAVFVTSVFIDMVRRVWREATVDNKSANQK